MESASPFTITKEQAERLAETLRSGGHLNFTNMANRNWVAKICKQKRIPVRKGSIRNQLLDPRYTVEGSDIPDRGLANDYKHYHAVLYKLEADRYSYSSW
jgi:hypothetical protein